MILLLAMTVALGTAPLGVAEKAVPPSLLACSANGLSTVTRKSDLPTDVRHFIADIADRGERFRSTDGVVPGDENLPYKRLVCGYPTLDGYVVEQEVGGRALQLVKVPFRRTRYGYERG